MSVHAFMPKEDILHLMRLKYTNNNYLVNFVNNKANGDIVLDRLEF